MSNTPELIYILGGASYIGAKLNIFGSQYPNDYITEIINECNTDIIFIEDNAYSKISKGIEDSTINKIIMTSLSNSLKEGTYLYKELDDKIKLFDNKVDLYKNNNNKIINIDEFINLGKNYTGEIDGNANLDTEFSITYTSGSTNEKKP